ncbi:hypothetical protein FRC07_005641 [Ceratobasidium sp. 392]|nr:hypothetical protein FRC07_005641 [Ceratobasidium sp. 392]
MSSTFRKKASSKRSVDAYSDFDGSESDAAATQFSVATSNRTAEPSKPSPPPETVKPLPKREPLSSESWTIIIVVLLGIVGRLLYANFGGIQFWSVDPEDTSLLATLLRDLNTQEGTIGAVIIGTWEGILLHQIMRLSARAAAGVFAGLAGRLLLDLVSASPGQAVRFTASLLGISLGMLLSEVIRGVFDEKDHWEDRKITHYHNRSRRLRKSSGRRRRTTSGETLEDPDATDDPRSVAPSTAIVSTRGARSDYDRPRHRRALSDLDSRSRPDTIVRVTSPLPSTLTGDLEAEIAELRRQANVAAGQQRKYQEAREVKRYEALAESLTRQVGDKIVEAHRRAVEKELATPLPAARPITPSHRPAGSSSRAGGYYSESDALRNPNPVRVTVSAGGQTYEMTADEEEVEIGPNLRVRTRHVYQPQTTPQPQQSSSTHGSAAPASGRSTPTRTPAPTATAAPTHSRPPRSVPQSKLGNPAQPVGGIDEDMRSAGSKSRTRSRRGGE